MEFANRIVWQGGKVPEDELQKILVFLAGLDMRRIAQSVMEELFRRPAKNAPTQT